MSKEIPFQIGDMIYRVTRENLLARCILGVERLPSDIMDKKVLKELLPEGVERFILSTNDGLGHSMAVLTRMTHISNEGHDLLARMPDHSSMHEDRILALLEIAAIFHNIGRFFGNMGIHKHQKFGAVFAQYCFQDDFADEDEKEFLREILIIHDYVILKGRDGDISEEDRRRLLNPATELFRLADETTLTPGDEIRRLMMAGRRVFGDNFKAGFLNASISDSQRVEWMLKINETENGGTFSKWDWMQFCLILFMSGDHSWMYPEAKAAYRSWADCSVFGKQAAIKEIARVAEGLGLNPKEPLRIIERVVGSFA